MALNATGYSGTPLWKKLDFKSSMKVAVLNAPSHCNDLLAAFQGFERRRHMKGRTFMRLVDVNVCAVNADWSGLKLMRRKSQPV